MKKKGLSLKVHFKGNPYVFSILDKSIELPLILCKEKELIPSPESEVFIGDLKFFEASSTFPNDVGVSFNGLRALQVVEGDLDQEVVKYSAVVKKLSGVEESLMAVSVNSQRALDASIFLHHSEDNIGSGMHLWKTEKDMVDSSGLVVSNDEEFVEITGGGNAKHPLTKKVLERMGMNSREKGKLKLHANEWGRIINDLWKSVTYKDYNRPIRWCDLKFSFYNSEKTTNDGAKVKGWKDDAELPDKDVGVCHLHFTLQMEVFVV